MGIGDKRIGVSPYTSIKSEINVHEITWSRATSIRVINFHAASTTYYTYSRVILCQNSPITQKLAADLHLAKLCKRLYLGMCIERDESSHV